MFNDNTNFKQEDKEIMNLKTMSKDGHDVHMTGEIIDRIHYADGRVEERVGHNLVVNNFLNLVMSLLKQQSGYKGIQYWAVGSGASSWDGSMPNPDINSTKLTAELGRVAIGAGEIKFLNSDYNEVSTPTNILQISHTFGPSDCNGVWREFGIFGGNATTAKDSGIMINKRHHAVITKTEEMTIERVMRFTLNLV
jgi:hypothetical protein